MIILYDYAQCLLCENAKNILVGVALILGTALSLYYSMCILLLLLQRLE